jgi:hypothetical protein
MPRDVEVQDAPPIVTDHEKTVEQTERDGGDREEIHRRDGFSVVTKEGQPSLGRLGTSRRSLHATRDRSFREVESKHKEFAMDARSSPGGVLGDHAEDQLPDLLRRLLSPNLHPDFGDQLPVKAEISPMPSDHGLRRDHDEGLFPL